MRTDHQPTISIRSKCANKELPLTVSKKSPMLFNNLKATGLIIQRMEEIADSH